MDSKKILVAEVILGVVLVISVIGLIVLSVAAKTIPDALVVTTASTTTGLIGLLVVPKPDA